MVAFQKYQQFPEYKIINYNMSLPEFKSIFWWEFIHRFTGRMIGVVFLIPFLWFYFTKKLKPRLLRQLLGVFLLGGLQGFIGWLMVASGLVDRPEVSHYRLATHLITAFITFGYILWIMLDIIYENVQQQPVKDLRKWSRWIFAVVLVQIVYGGFVAGLKAGLVYNTWPKMGNAWFPDTIIALKPVWVNFLENKNGVQFMHRYIAYLVLILILLAFAKFKDAGLERAQKRAIYMLASIVLVQFTLGVLTLVFSVPLLLGVLHQLGAFFLFGSAVYLLHTSRPRQKSFIEPST